MTPLDHMLDDIFTVMGWCFAMACFYGVFVGMQK